MSLCSRCGYDRNRDSLAHACPECGLVINENAPSRYDGRLDSHRLWRFGALFVSLSVMLCVLQWALLVHAGYELLEIVPIGPIGAMMILFQTIVSPIVVIVLWITASRKAEVDVIIPIHMAKRKKCISIVFCILLAVQVASSYYIMYLYTVYSGV